MNTGKAKTDILKTRILDIVRQGTNGINQFLELAAKALSQVSEENEVYWVRVRNRFEGGLDIVESVTGKRGRAASNQELTTLYLENRLLTRGIPVRITSKRINYNDWYLYILPKNGNRSDPMLTELATHCVDFVGRVLPIVIELSATSTARKVLRTKNFVRRGIDNYLGYAVVNVVEAAFGPDLSSTSVWRTSRREAQLQLIAKWSQYEMDDIPYAHKRGDVDAFLTAFGVKPYTTCIAVADSTVLDSELANIIGIVNSMIEGAYGITGGEDRRAALSVSASSVVIHRTANAQDKQSRMYFPSSCASETVQAFTRTITELSAFVRHDESSVLIFLPLLPEQYYGNQSDISAETSEKRFNHPTKLHELPFACCVVLQLSTCAVSAFKLQSVARMAQIALCSTDSHSHYRLQMSLFLQALDRLGEADDEETMRATYEFTARNVFEADAVVEVSTKANRKAPSYVSEHLKNSPLIISASDLAGALSAKEWDFFIYDVRKICPKWLQVVHDATPKDKDDEHDPSQRNFVSGYYFTANVHAHKRIIYFIRARASQKRAIDYSLAKTLQSFITKTIEIAKRPFRIHRNLAFEGRSSSESALDAETVFRTVGALFKARAIRNRWLLFTYNGPSDILMGYSATMHPDKELVATVLRAEESSLAGVCIRRKTDVGGYVCGNRVIVNYVAGRRLKSPESVMFRRLLWPTNRLLAVPIRFDGGICAVVIVSHRTRETKAGGREFRKRVVEAIGQVDHQLEELRNFNSVQLRVETFDIARKLRLHEPPQPLPSHELHRNLPPELAVIYEEEFCRTLQRLLEEYAIRMKWHSVSIRLSDWFDRKLYRIALYGIPGPNPVVAATDLGVVPYVFRMRKVVSLPTLDSAGLRYAEVRYPGLSYVQGRAGSLSELCIPIVDFNNQSERIGIVNFESQKRDGFVLSSWAAVRLADMVEEILSLRRLSFRTFLKSPLALSKTFLAHAYHDLKNEIDPILTYAHSNVVPLLSEERGGGLMEKLNEEKDRLTKRMEVLARTKVTSVSLSLHIDRLMQKLLLASKHSEDRIKFDSKGDGDTINVSLDVNVLTHAINSVITDMRAFCSSFLERRYKDSITIYVRYGIGSSGCWELHIGYKGIQLSESLAKSLFWYRVTSTKSTGAGLAFIGTYFAALGFYARATRQTPNSSLLADVDIAREPGTWFSFYLKGVPDESH